MRISTIVLIILMILVLYYYTAQTFDVVETVGRYILTLAENAITDLKEAAGQESQQDKEENIIDRIKKLLQIPHK